MATNHKDTIRQVNEAFASNDIDAVFALCHADIQWNMVGQPLMNGIDEVRSFMGNQGGAPPAIHIGSIVSEGDEACCDGTMEMADAPGEPAQQYGFSDMYRFDSEGRITEIRSYIVKMKSGN